MGTGAEGGGEAGEGGGGGGGEGGERIACESMNLLMAISYKSMLHVCCPPCMKIAIRTPNDGATYPPL